MLSIFRACIAGFVAGARTKTLQCCGEPGEVAGGGVVIACESYCIVNLVLFVVVLVF